MTDLPKEPAAGLWERLLAGRVSEVCVLSYRGLYQDLPQTLGLEVIDYGAYVYDSRGVARTPEERYQLASRLAAEPRWLAIGGPRYWVEHFATRAGAILVMPAPFEVAIDQGMNAATRSLGQLLRTAFTGRDRREPVLGSVTRDREFTGDVPMTGAQLSRYFAQTRNFLAGEFPDKTFVLQGGDDVRQLRSVRVRPRGTGDG